MDGLCVVTIWMCLVVFVTSQSCSVFSSANTARQMASTPISGQKTFFGLVLPVHRHDATSGAVCGQISNDDVIKAEAFLWALRTFWNRWSEISSSSQNGIVFDSCGSADRLYEHLYPLEYGSPPTPGEAINVLAYLVSDTESVTVRLSKLLRTRNATVVGASLTDAGTTSPLLYHMSPTADQEADAILRLLQRSKWRYVQVLYSDDSYGKILKGIFAERAEGYGVVVGRTEAVDDGTVAVLDPYPSVVVIFAYSDQKRRLITGLANQDFIVIATNIPGDITALMKSQDSTSRIVELRSELPSVYDTATNKFRDEIFKKLTSAGTADVTNPWYVQFWETSRKCYIRDSSKTMYNRPCNGSTTLGDSIPYPREAVAFIIQGADLMVKALARTCKTSCPADTITNRRKAFNEQFQTLGFETEDIFDTQTMGPRLWGYDVYLYSRSGGFTRQTAGYVRKNVLVIDELANVNTDRLITANVARVVRATMRDEEDGGTRYGVWGYVWTIVIAVLAGLGIILVLVIALLLFILVSRGAVSNYVWLYAVLLFGAFLGYLTLFAFLPIPTTATCGIIRFGVGFSYGICFSVMVILGLLLCKKTELFSSTRVSNIFIAASLILLIAIELVVLVIWLVWTPPGVAYVLYPGFQGPLRTCSHFTLDAGNIIVRTVFENHLLYLIYIMLLILLVLVLAIFIFMRRKYLRASRDKTESYALLAAGIGTGIGTVAIWLTWTLVGALAGPLHNDVHNYGDAALAFGLWFTLTWLLIFLLVQIVNAWRNGSKLKVITREVKTNLSHTNDAHIIAREGDYKQSLTTVDGRVSHPGSVNKMPLILQPNGGTSYTSYEQHVETRTEGKTHGRPAPVPEHAELSTSHKHVFHGGSNFCAECGFAHDPAALHLVHPRSEHSSHNTSLEYNLHTTRPHNTSLDYNLHTTRQEGLLQEPRLATSLQALHLIHPRSRPVSRAGSLDLGHTHLTSHGMNTRVARSEVGSSHGTSGTNVIDLRRPRHHHHNRAYYYPSNYNNNVYFTGHSSKGMSVI